MLTFLGKHLRALAALTAAVWLAFATAVLSPYWVTWRLLGALEAGDADTVIGYCDFERLRAAARAEMAARSRVQAPETRPGAAAGRALGEALAGALLASLVSPEGLRALMAKQKAGAWTELEVRTSYRDAATFAVHLARPGGAALTAVLRREPWPWRVVALEGIDAGR